MERLAKLLKGLDQVHDEVEVVFLEKGVGIYISHEDLKEHDGTIQTIWYLYPWGTPGTIDDCFKLIFEMNEEEEKSFYSGWYDEAE